jgi:hypothetical protein
MSAARHTTPPPSRYALVLTCKITRMEDLLQPTLGHRDSASTSIYSARVGYLTSFLGGPIAGSIVALANARRLKRLSTDWPLALLAIAMTAGPMWWWLHGGARWVGTDEAGRVQSVAFRALGLAFFALLYRLHRQYYRNMTLFGLTPPSGWIIGIASVILGTAINIGLAAVLS